MTGTQLRERRRQRRHDAEREILEAAERLLRTRPFRELTVDDVMAATTQSRTAFYRCFTDRHDLLLRLAAEVGEQLYAVADLWLSGTGDPRVEGRAALERLVDVYAEHGPLVRAVAEAASHDADIERAYAALAQRFVDATARRIERDIAAGRTPAMEPAEVATALVWMNERYLGAMFGRPGAGDRALAVRTLYTIWMRTLYGGEEAAPSASRPH